MRVKRRKRAPARRALALVVGIAVAAPGTARADWDFGFSDDSGIDVEIPGRVIGLVLAGSAVLVAAASTTTWFNNRAVKQGRRPSTTMAVLGYVIGAASVVAGVALIQQLKEYKALTIPTGLSVVAVGATSFGVTLYGHWRPEREEPARVTLVPQVLPASRSTAGYGAGLHVTF